jgi:hypothetical protein
MFGSEDVVVVRPCADSEADAVEDVPLANAPGFAMAQSSAAVSKARRHPDK